MEKRMLLLIFPTFIFLLAACEEKPNTPEKFFSNTATTVVDPLEYAQIKFDTTSFNFGTVKEGTIVKHEFTFTNTGKIPLTITNASASCGCTVPSYPKEAIEPGGKGSILVEFNTSGKLGVQNKSIIIAANTLPNTHTLQLKGNVKGLEP